MSTNGCRMDKTSKAERFSFDWMPSGEKFCPSDHELIIYYLRPKVQGRPMYPNPIEDTQLTLYTPMELQEKYRSKRTDAMYFFTVTVRKYPKGNRPDRKAGSGYWKASNNEEKIERKGKVIGGQRTLVFYSSKNVKTNWIMHEYKMPDNDPSTASPSNSQELVLVLCKIYERDKAKSDTFERKKKETTKSRKASKHSPSLSMQPQTLLGPQPLNWMPPAEAVDSYQMGYAAARNTVPPEGAMMMSPPLSMQPQCETQTQPQILQQQTLIGPQPLAWMPPAEAVDSYQIGYAAARNTVSPEGAMMMSAPLSMQPQNVTQTQPQILQQQTLLGPQPLAWMPPAEAVDSYQMGYAAARNTVPPQGAVMMSPPLSMQCETQTQPLTWMPQTAIVDSQMGYEGAAMSLSPPLSIQPQCQTQTQPLTWMPQTAIALHEGAVMSPPLSMQCETQTQLLTWMPQTAILDSQMGYEGALSPPLSIQPQCQTQTQPQTAIADVQMGDATANSTAQQSGNAVSPPLSEKTQTQTQTEASTETAFKTLEEVLMGDEDTATEEEWRRYLNDVKDPDDAPLPDHDSGDWDFSFLDS